MHGNKFIYTFLISIFLFGCTSSVPHSKEKTFCDMLMSASIMYFASHKNESVNMLTIDMLVQSKALLPPSQYDKTLDLQEFDISITNERIIISWIGDDKQWGTADDYALKGRRQPRVDLPPKKRAR